MMRYTANYIILASEKIGNRDNVLCCAT